MATAPFLHMISKKDSPSASHSSSSESSPSRRSDLTRLRKRLTEPCALKDRDLLTLLSYALGGDGDPIVGLLDDARATIGLLGDSPSSAGTEPNLLASLERRLAVALELYSRATSET